MIAINERTIKNVSADNDGDSKTEKEDTLTFSGPPANSNLSTLSIRKSKLVSFSFRIVNRFSVSSTLLLKSGTGLESTSCQKIFF